MNLEIKMNPPDPSGQHEEFGGWVREHGRAVRGYLLAQLGRPDLAEELAQEVFLRAWQARGRYQEQGSLRAYLVRIADRLVCDLARRNGRERTARQTASQQDHLIQTDPAELVMAQEACQLLRLALEELSAAQRRVLLLRYYGQMSFAQIAQTMGVPLNTVLSHCHRGLEKLRKIFQQKMPKEWP